MKTHENSQNLPDLSHQQQKAAILLAEGKSITAVARELGMARETLSRWNSHHPVFMARVNQLKNDLLEELEDQAYGLISAAFQCLETAIRSDPKVALEFLVKTGIIEQLQTQIKDDFSRKESDPEKILSTLASHEAQREFLKTHNETDLYQNGLSGHPELLDLEAVKKKEIIKSLTSERQKSK